MRFLLYTLVRIGLMAVVFLLCLLLKIGLVVSGIFAVLIGFAIAYLAFPKLHAEASREVAGLLCRRAPRKRRARERAQQETELEDAYVEDQLRREGRQI